MTLLAIEHHVDPVRSRPRLKVLPRGRFARDDAQAIDLDRVGNGIRWVHRDTARRPRWFGKALAGERDSVLARRAYDENRSAFAGDEFAHVRSW